MEMSIKQKAESKKLSAHSGQLSAVSCKLIAIAFVLFAVHAKGQVITLDSVLAMVDQAKSHVAGIR